VCSIKLKQKALRSQYVLTTFFTPQIQYRLDGGDVDGQDRRNRMKVLQRMVGTRTLLEEGKLRSLGCDYHEACRISLFTQLLIKFRKQNCYSEGAREIPHLCGTPKFYYSLKNSTLFYLKNFNVTSLYMKTPA
jgi:hypothetical protein